MKTSIITAEHYKWGDGCDGWHLLQSPTLSVIQERIPPRAKELLHYHQKAQQVFYILSGSATFQVGDEEFTVAANESLHVPRGVRHCISNNGNHDLHFIVISEPKSHGDRINVDHQ